MPARARRLQAATGAGAGDRLLARAVSLDVGLVSPRRIGAQPPRSLSDERTMPSLLHEGILELIRERPGFAADLLRQILHVDVPAFTEARLAEAALNDLVPVEYRADAVILFVDGRPVFGCVVEAQLSEDPRKAFTWPMYAVNARARHECPFVVLIIAPDETVAH